MRQHLLMARRSLDICAFAKQHDIDLIVSSTHGLTGFEHVLIGSIAEKVVRRAPCSVLVVPSHPQTRIADLREAGAHTRRTTAQKGQQGRQPNNTYCRSLIKWNETT